MTDITIYRQYPIISGYVQIQPNYEQTKCSYLVQDILDLNPSAVVKRGFHPDTGPTTGRSFGCAEWIEAPFSTILVLP